MFCRVTRPCVECWQGLGLHDLLVSDLGLFLLSSPCFYDILIYFLILNIVCLLQIEYDTDPKINNSRVYKAFMSRLNRWIRISYQLNCHP